MITTLDEYIEKLIEITIKETGLDKSQISVNRDEVNEYFQDGIPPYFCFREEWN